MADVVSKEKRSQMMANIKGKNTKPELLVRSGLHRLGYRFKIHDNSLPGKPDIKLTKYRSVIFIHGCFWHKHNCHLFKMPSTRQDFWRSKFETNQINDKENLKKLYDFGWRICVIWECSLKGKTKLPLSKILNFCDEWLKSSDRFLEIKGT